MMKRPLTSVAAPIVVPATITLVPIRGSLVLLSHTKPVMMPWVEDRDWLCYGETPKICGKTTSAIPRKLRIDFMVPILKIGSR